MLKADKLSNGLKCVQPPRLIKETSLPHVTSHPRPRPTDDSAGSLTKGQLNAVRAAFKAGVKPSAIARQFGISQSNVRKALASDARDHKSDR
jgi:predicted DNA binding protein